MRGATLPWWSINPSSTNFYSHASCEARLGLQRLTSNSKEISTHTPLARRDLPFWFDADLYSVISTHTPLARRDACICFISGSLSNFYSHASCEARLERNPTTFLIFLFLLTRLLRGATIRGENDEKPRVFLLTRLLRGATAIVCVLVMKSVISTHTPLARRDTHWPHGISIQSSFLLTRLLRGATVARYIMKKHLGISTHTPLARRDCRISFFSSCFFTFLLTRLLRGATVARTSFLWAHSISTHTPLARRDSRLNFERSILIYFYSHASCEARPTCICCKAYCILFLLTRLLRGATLMHTSLRRNLPFLLTRLLRGATKQNQHKTESQHNFYSHASCEARLM